MTISRIKSTPTITSNLDTNQTPPGLPDDAWKGLRTFYHWMPGYSRSYEDNLLHWGVTTYDYVGREIGLINERQSIKFEVDISGGTKIDHYKSAEDKAAGGAPVFSTTHKPFGIRIYGMGHRYIRWQAGYKVMNTFSNIQTRPVVMVSSEDAYKGTDFWHGVDTPRYIDIDTLPIPLDDYHDAVDAIRQQGTGWVDQSGWVGQYDSPPGLTADRALITICGPGITHFEFLDQASRDMVRKVYWVNTVNFQSPLPLGGVRTDPATWEAAADERGLFRDCKGLTIAPGCKFAPSFKNANGTFKGCTSLGGTDLTNIRWLGVTSLFYTFAGVPLPGWPILPNQWPYGWKPSDVWIAERISPAGHRVPVLFQYPQVDNNSKSPGSRHEYLPKATVVTWHSFDIALTEGPAPTGFQKTPPVWPEYLVEPSYILVYIPEDLMAAHTKSLFVAQRVAAPYKLYTSDPAGTPDPSGNWVGTAAFLNFYRTDKKSALTIGRRGGVVRLNCYGEKRYFTAYEPCDPIDPPPGVPYIQSIGAAAGDDPDLDYTDDDTKRASDADIIKYSLRKLKFDMGDKLLTVCDCPDPLIMELLCRDNPDTCSLRSETQVLFEPTAGTFGITGVVAKRTWYINRVYKDARRLRVNDYQVYYLDATAGCGVGYIARHYEDTPRVFEASVPGAYPNTPSGATTVWEGVNVKMLFDSIESAVSKYPLVVFKSEDGRLRGSDAVYSGVNQAAKPLYGQNEDDFIDNQVQVWGLKYDPQTAKGLSTDVVPEKRRLWAITNPTSYVGPAYFTVNGLRLLRHAVAFTNSVKDGPFRIPGTKKTLYSIKGGSITVLRSNEENFAAKFSAALNRDDEFSKSLLVAYDGIRDSQQIYIPVDGDPPGLSAGTLYQTESLGNDRYRINGTEYQGLDLNGKFWTWWIDAPWQTPDHRVGTGDVGVPNSILTVDAGWALKYHTDGNGVEHWMVRSTFYHECLYNYHYILTNEGRMLPNGALDPGARAVAAVDVDTTKYHYDISIFSAGDSYWWEYGYDYPNGLIGRGVVPPNAPGLV